MSLVRLLCFCLIVVCPEGALANDFYDCDHSAENPDVGIPACTRLIDRPQEVDGRAAYNNRGAAWFAKGDLDAAISDFSAAIQRDPSFADAFHNRGRALLRSGAFDKAIVDFGSVIRLNPNNPFAYNDRGLGLLNKGEMHRAIADFDKAISLHPLYAGAISNRASAWHNIDDLDRALEDYHQVIQLAPLDPTGYTNRAIVWIDKGDFEKALDDYNAALNISTNDWRFYSGRGEVLRLIGDYQKSLADHAKAIALAPSSTDALHNRSLVWKDKGDLTRAIEDLSEAILIDPNYSRAYGTRGEIWRLRGDLSRSLLDLDKAIALVPKGPLYLRQRAETWRFKGDFERALADYNAALIINHEDVASFVGRGLTFEKMNQLDHARADYEKALSIPPEKDATSAKPAQLTAQAHLSAILARQEDGTKARIPHDGGRRVALIFGNANYNRFQPLKNPGHDATAVAAVLRKIGFDVIQLHKDASRSQMVQALRDFAIEVRSADWAVVYYAGHGVEYNGVNYLVPKDAEMDFAKKTSQVVPLDSVLSAVQSARKLKLVILDACRENPFGKAKPQVSSTEESIGTGFGRINPKGATMVVYAAKHGQLAADGDGDNSPFATSLMRRLQMPGIEINKMFRLVRDDVIDSTVGRQEPFTYGSLPGREEFYFYAVR